MPFGLQMMLHSLTTDHFILRSLILSFAVTYVLTPPELSRRSLMLYLLRLLGVETAMLVIQAGMAWVTFSLMLPMYWFMLSDFIRNMVITLLYAVFICRYTGLVKLTMGTSILAAISICVDLTFSLGRIVDSAAPGYTLPLLLLIYGILAAFALFEVHFSIAEVSDYPLSGAVLVIITNAIAISVTLTTQLLDTTTHLSNVYSVLVYSVLLILVCASYLAIYFICIERNETYKFKMENQMMRAGAEQIALTRSNLADLRRVRHDMKNAYAYMRALLDEKKYEELAKTLDTFSPQKLTPEFYVDCGNSDVSAILTVESTKAHNHGIRIRHTLIVPPVLPLEGGELFSLLSNLLDNAIESNLRYGITDDITVQMSLREQYLYIGVTNKIPATEDRGDLLRLKTRKGHPEEHGLGTQIVKRLAEKYNGYFLPDIDGDRFVAEVLIDMMYNKGRTQA